MTWADMLRKDKEGKATQSTEPEPSLVESAPAREAEDPAPAQGKGKGKGGGKGSQGGRKGGAPADALQKGSPLSKPAAVVPEPSVAEALPEAMQAVSLTAVEAPTAEAAPADAEVETAGGIAPAPEEAYPEPVATPSAGPEQGSGPGETAPAPAEAPPAEAPYPPVQIQEPVRDPQMPPAHPYPPHYNPMMPGYAMPPYFNPAIYPFPHSAHPGMHMPPQPQPMMVLATPMAPPKPGSGSAEARGGPSAAPPGPPSAQMPAGPWPPQDYRQMQSGGILTTPGPSGAPPSMYSPHMPPYAYPPNPAAYWKGPHHQYYEAVSNLPSDVQTPVDLPAGAGQETAAAEKPKSAEEEAKPPAALQMPGGSGMAQGGHEAQQMPASTAGMPYPMAPANAAMAHQMLAPSHAGPFQMPAPAANMQHQMPTAAPNSGVPHQVPPGAAVPPPAAASQRPRPTMLNPHAPVYSFAPAASPLPPHSSVENPSEADQPEDPALGPSPPEDPFEQEQVGAVAAQMYPPYMTAAARKRAAVGGAGLEGPGPLPSQYPAPEEPSEDSFMPGYVPKAYRSRPPAADGLPTTSDAFGPDIGSEGSSRMARWTGEDAESTSAKWRSDSPGSAFDAPVQGGAKWRNEDGKGGAPDKWRRPGMDGGGFHPPGSSGDWLAPELTADVAQIALHCNWPWSQSILRGEKTIETRHYSLPAQYVGVPVALIESPGQQGREHGVRRSVIGTVVFGASFAYKSEEEWAADGEKHLVPRGDPEFGWDASRTKHAWPITAAWWADPHTKRFLTRLPCEQVWKSIQRFVFPGTEQVPYHDRHWG